MAVALQLTGQIGQRLGLVIWGWGYRLRKADRDAASQIPAFPQPGRWLHCRGKLSNWADDIEREYPDKEHWNRPDSILTLEILPLL